MPIPQSPKKTFNKTSREIVYEGLNQWIMDGTLQPGEKLMDSEVAEYFAVSRTPAREAIQMLANQQLIVVEPGKGSYVAPIEESTISQVYTMLAELNRSAVDLGFERITDDHISDMVRYNGLCVDAYNKGDSMKLSGYDHAFHGVYIKLAGNEFLEKFVDELNIHATRFRNLFFKYYTPSFNDHEDLIAAFSARDKEKALDVAYRNWTWSQTFSDYLKQMSK